MKGDRGEMGEGVYEGGGKGDKGMEWRHREGG